MGSLRSLLGWTGCHLPTWPARRPTLFPVARSPLSVCLVHLPDPWPGCVPALGLGCFPGRNGLGCEGVDRWVPAGSRTAQAPSAARLPPPRLSFLSAKWGPVGPAAWGGVCPHCWCQHLAPGSLWVAPQHEPRWGPPPLRALGRCRSCRGAGPAATPFPCVAPSAPHTPHTLARFHSLPARWHTCSHAQTPATCLQMPVHVYTHATHTHLPARLHARRHVSTACSCASTFMHTPSCLFTHTCLHTYTHIHAHTLRHSFLHTYTPSHYPTCLHMPAPRKPRGARGSCFGHRLRTRDPRGPAGRGRTGAPGTAPNSRNSGAFPEAGGPESRCGQGCSPSGAQMRVLPASSSPW